MIRVKKPEYVIYQCNEDDVADTIKPRLKSAGADCSKGENYRFSVG